MPYFADIYVLQLSRSKALAERFLDHFLPQRKESSEVYELPQYGETVDLSFDKSEELMDYLEANHTIPHRVDWHNLDPTNPNYHGMVGYTKDACMIFGLSRAHASIDNIQNEEEGLAAMKTFLNSAVGYITYECPPEDTYLDFVQRVQQFDAAREHKKTP